LPHKLRKRDGFVPSEIDSVAPLQEKQISLCIPVENC